MSGKSAKSVSAVVTGNGKKRHSSLKRFTKPGLLVVGLLLVAGVAWFVGSRTNPTQPQKVKLSPQQVVDQAVNKTTLNPDYASAKKTLSSRTVGTGTNQEKAKAYAQLGSIAIQQGDNQATVDNLTKAIQLDPGREAAMSRNLADAYKALGDKANAIKYYQKAITYYQTVANSPMSGNESYVTDAQAAIKELQK